jgi:hypothetical protein
MNRTKKSICPTYLLGLETFPTARTQFVNFTLTFEDAPVEPLKNYIRKASTCASRILETSLEKIFKMLGLLRQRQASKSVTVP